MVSELGRFILDIESDVVPIRETREIPRILMRVTGSEAPPGVLSLTVARPRPPVRSVFGLRY